MTELSKSDLHKKYVMEHSIMKDKKCEVCDEPAGCAILLDSTIREEDYEWGFGCIGRGHILDAYHNLLNKKNK